MDLLYIDGKISYFYQIIDNIIHLTSTNIKRGVGWRNSLQLKLQFPQIEDEALHCV